MYMDKHASYVHWCYMGTGRQGSWIPIPLSTPSYGVIWFMFYIKIKSIDNIFFIFFIKIFLFFSQQNWTHTIQKHFYTWDISPWMSNMMKQGLENVIRKPLTLTLDVMKQVLPSVIYWNQQIRKKKHINSCSLWLQMPVLVGK